MVNVNISGLYPSENNKEYNILLSVYSYDKNSIKQIERIDKLLITLYERINKVDRCRDGNDYYLPYDIDYLLKVLELIPYVKDTSIFLNGELVTKDQLSKRDFSISLIDFFKKCIDELKEVEKIRSANL